ncbi:MAG: serine/threonine protein kinase [Actinobacteria bacterium]|nr:MAG: serine/threonine protein kinase [Actinomycetota bacterium]
MGIVDSNKLLLGRYEIVELIGEGGFGRVWKAFDKRMERAVAVKEIPTGARTAQRAINEARTIALLNHPNIVTVYEFEETPEAYYLIMEYLEGLTLAEILDAAGALPLQVALAIGVQMCHGLENAHLNNVIHRDVKPENVILLPDGRLKVMDFGISRLRGRPMNKDEVIGTVFYMSPEALTGGIVDQTSDEFSLAMVVYEMLAGSSPFDASTTSAAVFQILNSAVRPPSELNPKIGKRLEDALLKALAKDPAERYEGVIDFRYRLEKALGPKAAPEKILKAFAAKIYDGNEDVRDGALDLPQPRRRLAEFVAERAELLRRLSTASAVTVALAYLVLRHLPMPPGPLFLGGAFAWVITLLVPPAGIALAFVLSVVAAFGVSKVAGLAAAFVLTAYWLAVSRTRPFESLLPFIAPVAAALRLALLFPVLAGFCLPPAVAALVAGLGGFAMELFDLFATGRARFVDVGVPLSLADPAGLWRIVTTFALNPLLILQPLLWAAVAATISVVASKRSKLLDGVATLGGLAALAAAYLTVLAVPSPTGDLGGPVMQSLAFSLIIMLVILGLFPYERTRQKRQSR